MSVLRFHSVSLAFSVITYKVILLPIELVYNNDPISQVNLEH